MGNQGLAFGLVFASGAATFLGALGILFSKRELDKRFLSVSLAASAGVMIYVSFVEILCVKAFEGFVESHFSEVRALTSTSVIDSFCSYRKLISQIENGIHMKS